MWIEPVHFLLNPSLSKTLDAADALLDFGLPFFTVEPKRELNETRPIRFTNLLTSGPFFIDRRLLTDFCTSSDLNADTFNVWPLARFTGCFILISFFVWCKRALSVFVVKPNRARTLFDVFASRSRFARSATFRDSISKISSVDENFTTFSPVSIRSPS